MEESEKGKCSCCFTFRGVIVSTIIFLVSVLLFVIVLDLCILEIHRQREAETMTDTYGNIGKLSQVGGILEYRDGDESTRNLRLLELRNVEANVTKLALLLRSTYYGSLQTILLENVTLTGKIPNMLRGYLWYIYRLNDYKLELNIPIGPDADFQLDPCDECVMDSITDTLEGVRMDTCLDNFLVFISKTGTSELYIEPRIFSQINLDVKVYGRNLLKITRPNNATTEREVTIMFTNCTQILDKILSFSQSGQTENPFIFSKLALHGCTDLKITTLVTILYGGHLKHLILDQVDFGLNYQEFNKILANSNSLKTFVWKNGPIFGTLDSPKILDVGTSPQIKFENLPKSLTHLALSHIRIGGIPDRNFNLRLNNLILDSVQFEGSDTIGGLLNQIEVKRFGMTEFNMDSIKEQSMAARRQAPRSFTTLLADLMKKSTTEIIYLHKIQKTKVSVSSGSKIIWERTGENTNTNQQSSSYFLQRSSIGKALWNLKMDYHGNPNLSPLAPIWLQLFSMESFYSPHLTSYQIQI